MGPPTATAYGASKAAVSSMARHMASELSPRGIRVNSVAPGPIWTPLIPSTMPPDDVEGFGDNTPLGRPGQPAELASAYVMLASDESSYTTGTRVEVTGGKPVL